MKIKASNSNLPSWHDFYVKSSMPEALQKLDELAHNIWWVWNEDGKALFKDINPDMWTEVRHNPIIMLQRLGYDKLEELSKDAAFLGKMNAIYDKFRKYIDVKPDSKRPSVAYFCMEYGLTHVLKIYSGGLGVLAGDYMPFPVMLIFRLIIM